MRKKSIYDEAEEIVRKNQFYNSERDLKRLPIDYEKSLLDAVRQGDYMNIKVMNFKLLDKFMGVSTKDKNKQFEYTVVASITLCTRAAIEGGLAPDRAYDISDAMLQKLEKADTVEEQHDIMENAAIIFAREVRQSVTEQGSYLVEQCKNYINRNIFRRISVKEIAAYVGRNPSYVPRVFSEKEGITIQSYIQREKINTACNLLRHTQSSVAEISQYMGFQPQSHFSKVFKKYTNMTALQYRNLYYEDIF